LLPNTILKGNSNIRTTKDTNSCIELLEKSNLLEILTSIGEGEDDVLNQK
jgi:hypothetical protein